MFSLEKLELYIYVIGIIIYGYYVNILFSLVFPLAVIFGFSYFCFIKPVFYWIELGVSQTSPYFILGDSWKILIGKENFSDQIMRCYNMFRSASFRYIGLYQFSTPILMIKDPKLIEQITVTDSDNFKNHRCSIPEVESFWTMNSPYLADKDWRHMRSILTPFFSSNSLKVVFRVMTECSQNFVNHFRNINAEDIIELEMFDTVTRYVNDVMATSVFGTEVNSLADPDNEIYRMGRKATDFLGILGQLKLFFYFSIPNILKVLEIPLIKTEVSRFFLHKIGRVMRTRYLNRNIRYDMIQLATEAMEKNGEAEDESFEKVPIGDFTNPEMTYQDVEAQSLTILLAGYHSISAVLCFTSHELAVNPNIQERLRKEIETTLEECEGKLTYESLMKMKYLDMVVSESLRKWPSTVACNRICTTSYKILAENSTEEPLVLQSGTPILIPILGLHRDPRYYPDPNCFNPERFSEENKANIVPFTYMPFGTGPRDCVGSSFALLTIKLLLFHLLSHYQLVIVEKTSINLKLSNKLSFVPTAEGGFWLGLKHIQK